MQSSGIIVFSIEPVGTVALIITKVFKISAIATAATKYIAQLRISLTGDDGFSASLFFLAFFFSSELFFSTLSLCMSAFSRLLLSAPSLLVFANSFSSFKSIISMIFFLLNWWQPP